MKINNIKDVSEYQLCCGCGVCAYLYPNDIEMVDIPCLGRRPNFLCDKATVTFDQALQVCPGFRVSHPLDQPNRKELISSLSHSWGPVLEIWEVHADDPEIRYKGSSGGAITAISLYCLEQGEMTGVLHVTAAPKRPYLNRTVVSTTRQSLLQGTGSRYSPASPCEKLGEIEKSDCLNVIVGKPCDINAVQNVRALKKQLDTKIGLTIACFCAGTPSTNGTLEMLRQMKVDDLGQLAGLRYRGKGWPGKTTAEPLDKSGKYKFKDLAYENSWGDILQKYRQWRCYICPDHTGEFADLAVGDPWYKERDENDIGRSLVIVRTTQGKKILYDAVAKGYLVAEKMEAWVLPASQPNLKETRAKLWGQLVALKLLRAPCPFYSGFHLSHNWWSHLSVIQKIRSILGTMKRVFKKNLKRKQEF